MHATQARHREITYALMRFILGALFVCHGAQKLFGAFGGHLGKGIKPDLLSLTGIGGIIEVVGGGLLLLGLFTRPVAFLLSGEMAVAYFLRHAPRGFWPIQNGGELSAILCFVFLYFTASGGGSWSLDRLLRGKSE